VIIVIGRQTTVAAMRINAHITRFWRDPGDHAGDKASAHIGGSRVLAVTSDRDAALPLLKSVSELIAESALHGRGQ
jgi:hypothetical protein